MNASPRRGPARPVGAALLALAVAIPSAARGAPLLEAELSLGGRGVPRALLAVSLAADPEEAPSLDFDLLGEPPPVTVPEDSALRRRRAMLRLHQGIGLGLAALHLATTAVGQLNYLDKYRGGPVTGRYEATHAVLAYGTATVFATNAAIALLAPTPKAKPRRGFDRISLHKLGMFTAAAGMLAQVGLGIYTDRREGYLNQERWATTHLAIGYATLAAVAVGVGALVL